MFIIIIIIIIILLLDDRQSRASQLLTHELIDMFHLLASEKERIETMAINILHTA